MNYHVLFVESYYSNSTVNTMKFKSEKSGKKKSREFCCLSKEEIMGEKNKYQYNFHDILETRDILLSFFFFFNCKIYILINTPSIRASTSKIFSIFKK